MSRSEILNRSIKISEETKIQLDKLGSKTDTYDSIIKKLIELNRQRRKNGKS